MIWQTDDIKVTDCGAAITVVVTFKASYDDRKRILKQISEHTLIYNLTKEE